MDDQNDGISITSCYLLHGYITDRLVQSSPMPFITLQSAHIASALTDTLRPFAATYIPSVDLNDSGLSSVTADALVDAGIHLNRECALLLSALYPVIDKGEYLDVATIIFQNRSFAHFFHSLSNATKDMQSAMGIIAEQIDPWPLDDEPLDHENQPSP